MVNSTLSQPLPQTSVHHEPISHHAKNSKLGSRNVLRETGSVKFQKNDIDTNIQLSVFGIFTHIHRLGSALTAPAEFLVGKFQIMSTGKSDFKFSFKIKLVCFGAFTVAVIIVSLPAALLRAFTTKFRKNYSYSPAIPPTSARKTASNHPSMTPTKELKIMTWNTGLGPDIMSVTNRLNKQKKRINDLMKMIIKKQPNVIALQEVFDDAATNALVKGLNQNGYDCIHSIHSTSPIALSSGLLLAVKRNSGIKLTIEEIKTFKFTNLKGPDAYSGKGAVGVKLRVSTDDGINKKLLVLNTHLQASYDDKGYGHVRQQQIRSLAHTVNQWKRQDIDQKASVILCGDLNFAQNPLEQTDLVSEYPEQIKTLTEAQLFNPNAAAQQQVEGSFYQLKVKEDEKPYLTKSLIDYIFLSNDLKEGTSEVVKLNIKNPNALSSDHCPVMQSVQLG